MTNHPDNPDNSDNPDDLHPDHPLRAGAGTVLVQFKGKLVETKKSWAEEGRKPETKPRDAGHGRRLPPGQTLTKDWPALDLGLQPAIDESDWAFSIAGIVQRPLTLDMDSYRRLPRVTDTSDIHCVTTWSRFDNTWEGVSFSHILDLVQPDSRASHAIFHCHDGYTTNLPLDELRKPNVVFADRWEGGPISREHGGPVRLIIPDLYFWKSPKWMKHMTLLDGDVKGYWDARGYHNLGDPWKEQRYDGD